MTTVRFWEWINGSWVKLTLHSAQPSIYHYKGEQHEEGWSSTANTWRLENNHIVRETTVDGRDCDGRLTVNYDCICPLNRVSKVVSPEEDEIIKRPDWRRVKSWQRDEYAEMMNY